MALPLLMKNRKLFVCCSNISNKNCNFEAILFKLQNELTEKERTSNIEMIKDIINHNADVVAGKKEFEVLREYFPQCFNSCGEFDIETFKASLPGGLSVTDETSGFNWLGKNYARMLTNMDTTTLIHPDEEHNSKPENKDSQNVYISGDNLDALQHLVKSYSGKVKVIYIDPPYNTGSDGFVYNDKFSFTTEDLANRLEITPERAERILSMTRRGSASHAAWLTFMLPRLSFARDLLTEDGVIFISIDDNEQANLKRLCDEVFGEECFVALVPWRKRTAKSDVPFGVSQDYEWILIYSKTQEFCASVNGKGRKYYTTNDFPNKPWRIHDMTTQRTAIERPNCFFTIINPKTGEKYEANPNRVWANSEDTFQQFYNENRIVFPGDYDFLNISKPVLRYWKKEDEKKSGDNFGRIAVSTKLDESMSQDGTKEITSLFDKKLFSYPKPSNLIKFLLSVNNADDFIVLDFFSGSGTTADAVMQLNAEDGGKRKFIMVQLPEETPADSEAANAGYKTIDQIGMERIKRAAKKIKADNFIFTGDLGFKHYILEEPKEDALLLMERFDPSSTGLTTLSVDDFGLETVLRTWLVADGYGLTEDAEEVMLGNYKAYWKEDYLYMVNPDNDFDASSIAALMDKYNSEPFSPHNIVIFGYSFGFTHREELQKNLRTLKEGNKTLTVNIDVRY